MTATTWAMSSADTLASLPSTVKCHLCGDAICELAQPHVANAKTLAGMQQFIGLTRHKISDREPAVAGNVGKKWMANTQEVDRRLARGSLHRLVRPSSDPLSLVAF
jgi:hypothetical protein